MSLDTVLARFTRRVPRFRGWHRLLEPLRRHYVRRYEGREDRWVEITDFQGDLRMRVDRAAYMGSLIYWRGLHAWSEAAILRRFLPRDGVFLDVGANQGELTLVAARLAPRGRVLAFEPVPEWHARLAENVRLNAFAHVTLVPAALSDHDGELEMFTSDDTRANASFNEGLSSLQRSEFRHVPLGRVSVRRLDDVVRREGLTRVDLVKIDTEGSERQVLAGASETLARFHPMLLVELNDEAFGSAGYSGEDLAHTLRALGYELFELDPFARLTPETVRPLPATGTLFARHALGH